MAAAAGGAPAAASDDEDEDEDFEVDGGDDEFAAWEGPAVTDAFLLNILN